MTDIQSICVYCGSSTGINPEFERAARNLGKSIAENNMRLIYGGGTNGLMGAVSDEVTKNGGKVTGIIPEFLLAYEASSRSLDHLDEVIKVDDMHTRKHMMFERADAFVTLPGGIGTLEEVVEMMTWAQLGRHQKPIVLANIENFWDPFTELLDHMIKSGFVKTGHAGQPLIINDPAKIIDAIKTKAANTGDEAIISKL